jgi:hypothetical protein
MKTKRGSKSKPKSPTAPKVAKERLRDLKAAIAEDVRGGAAREPTVSKGPA